MSATMTHDEYTRLPGWRWSHVKLLDSGSPLAVKHAIESPDEDTPARQRLRAIHAAVLEPDVFAATIAVFDGDRRAGKAWEAFLAEHEGATILKRSEYDDVRRTAGAIRSHPVVRSLLSEGRPEVPIVWTDEATGLPCKGRIDWLGPGYLLDLKTCGTVHERAVASLVARNLWHGQLAHYADGVRATGGPADLRCFIVAAEGKGAQDVAVYELDRGIPDGALHIGATLRATILRRLAECVRLDDWPGRHPGIETLCLPTYALDDTDTLIAALAATDAP